MIAANHPSYLDPILLSLQVKRPIRFMAWDALFRVPLLGAAGAAVRRLPGRRAPRAAAAPPTHAARELLAGGRAGRDLPGGQPLADGLDGARAARGRGAARARDRARRWCRRRSAAPSAPGRTSARCRASRRSVCATTSRSTPRPSAALPEEEATGQLLAELRRRVERTLMPGVKADARIEALWRTSAALAAAVRGRAGARSSPCSCSGRRERSRPSGRATPTSATCCSTCCSSRSAGSRSGSATARRRRSCCVYGGWALPQARPAGRDRRPRAAAPCWPAPASRTCTSGVASRRLRAGAGRRDPARARRAAARAERHSAPHVALPLFAAAFAWEERSVFWRYAAPLLLAYALAVPPGSAAASTCCPTRSPACWPGSRCAPSPAAGGEASRSRARSKRRAPRWACATRPSRPPGPR